MKQISTIFMIVTLLIISSCNNKEKINNDTPKQKPESTLTISDIEKAVEAFNQIMIDPKATKLEALCSNELTYGHSSGLTQNKLEFIDDLVNGPYDFTKVTSPDLAISVSENIGIARFIFLATAIKDGQQIDIRIGCVQVFQRENNNELKLLARQAYKLPSTANN